MSRTTTAEWLEIGERRSRWMLASATKRIEERIAPAAEALYGDGYGPTDPSACEALARQVDYLAALLRHAAETAIEENELDQGGEK